MTCKLIRQIFYQYFFANYLSISNRCYELTSNVEGGNSVDRLSSTTLNIQHLTKIKEICQPSSLAGSLDSSNDNHHRVHWNNTIIIVLVVGVVLCLSLVLLIVLSVRRFYKPERPRIKKTFVVRKQALPLDTTPLTTNRPIATEQCEITIENCCNMNYCDTVSD